MAIGNDLAAEGAAEDEGHAAQGQRIGDLEVRRGALEGNIEQHQMRPVDIEAAQRFGHAAPANAGEAAMELDKILMRDGDEVVIFHDEDAKRSQKGLDYEGSAIEGGAIKVLTIGHAQ